jgi:hypothetical protein
METFLQKILFLAYYKSRIWPSLPWLVVTSGSVNISGMIDSVDRGERISPGCLDPGAPAMWSEKETSRARDKVRFEIQAQGGKSASLLTPTPRGSGGNPVTSQFRRTSRSLPSTRAHYSDRAAGDSVKSARTDCPRATVTPILVVRYPPAAHSTS